MKNVQNAKNPFKNAKYLFKRRYRPYSDERGYSSCKYTNSRGLFHFECYQQGNEPPMLQSDFEYFLRQTKQIWRDYGYIERIQPGIERARLFLSECHRKFNEKFPTKRTIENVDSIEVASQKSFDMA